MTNSDLLMWWDEAMACAGCLVAASGEAQWRSIAQMRLDHVQ